MKLKSEGHRGPAHQRAALAAMAEVDHDEKARASFEAYAKATRFRLDLSPNMIAVMNAISELEKVPRRRKRNDPQGHQMWAERQKNPGGRFDIHYNAFIVTHRSLEMRGMIIEMPELRDEKGTVVLEHRWRLSEAGKHVLALMKLANL